MKRLMILSGSKYVLPIIQAARKLGIYTITADYLPNNIAHQYSDYYANVDISDKEATLKVALELNIDGVTSFASDPGVVTASYIAEKMHLPNVGPYESVCILQNKGKFRKYLSDNGFLVPISHSYKSYEDAIKDIDTFTWPVIVKPTDSAGSKGVSKAESADNLKNCIEKALGFSHSKEFIIEDFITSRGFSSDIDCFSIDGKLTYISFNSQLFDMESENPYTPSAYSFISSISEGNQRELQIEIQRLINLLGMKTSIFNIETRESIDGKAYIMEFAPRGGGNRLSECIRYATGIDMITNIVKYSVGLPLDEIIQKPFDGFWGEIILHSNTYGIFKKVWISDSIKKKIVDCDVWIEEGTKVKSFSAANEAIGTVIIRTDSKEEIDEVLSNQNKYVRVIVE